nr:unnamed protein product [Digitaria exilis]
MTRARGPRPVDLARARLERAAASPSGKAGAQRSTRPPRVARHGAQPRDPPRGVHARVLPCGRPRAPHSPIPSLPFPASRSRIAA